MDVTTEWRIDCPKCGRVTLAEHRDAGRVFVVYYGDPRCMSVDEYAEWKRVALDRRGESKAAPA